MTCSYETREVTGAGDWLAHNPEKAASNPVPLSGMRGPVPANCWPERPARHGRQQARVPFSVARSFAAICSSASRRVAAWSDVVRM